jgi:hypothetical protein
MFNLIKNSLSYHHFGRQINGLTIIFRIFFNCTVTADVLRHYCTPLNFVSTALKS